MKKNANGLHSVNAVQITSFYINPTNLYRPDKHPPAPFLVFFTSTQTQKIQPLTHSNLFFFISDCHICRPQTDKKTAVNFDSGR